MTITSSAGRLDTSEIDADPELFDYFAYIICNLRTNEFVLGKLHHDND